MHSKHRIGALLLSGLLCIGLGACGEPAGQRVETTVYTLQLSEGVFDRQAVAEDAAAEFYCGEVLSGGVRRHEAATAEEFRAVLFGDFSPFYPEGGVAEWAQSKPEAGIFAAKALVRLPGGGESLHAYMMEGDADFYEFWFDLTAVEEATAEEILASLCWGHSRTDSPDGTRSLTILDHDQYPQIFLWTMEEERLTSCISQHYPLLVDLAPPVTAGDPRWAPDGSRAVVAVQGTDAASFFFPATEDGGLNFPIDQIEDRLRAAGYLFEVPAAAEPQWELIPMEWSGDSAALRFTFAYTDINGDRQQGAAEYSIEGDQGTIHLQD